LYKTPSLLLHFVHCFADLAVGFLRAYPGISPLFTHLSLGKFPLNMLDGMSSLADPLNIFPTMQKVNKRKPDFRVLKSIITSESKSIILWGLFPTAFQPLASWFWAYACWVPWLALSSQLAWICSKFRIFKDNRSPSRRNSFWWTLVLPNL
jgi:hypothetical protein